MTAVTTLPGALSDRPTAWHAINWYAVHRQVRRLQARMVQAVQAKRWGKVHALQHLLPHSFSGKALAVKRVTTNDGSTTPGVDAMVWDTPAQKACAIEELRQRGYRALPLRRLYIPKTDGTGRQRPLSIPTMPDRAMQALYLLALDPIAEPLGDPNSYGFRTERSTADAIEQCFNVLARTHAPQWILEGDIRACFDGISHKWLLAHIPLDKAMLHKWLKAGFVDKHRLYPTEAGGPQGGICSPVIANLTLDRLERLLRAHYPPHTQRAQRAKVNLVRYCDDFIITGSSPAVLEQEVKPLVEHFLYERGLELSQAKPHITHLENGCDFLGQHVRQYAGKLLIKPAPKNVHTFLGNLRHIVKANKQATAGHLIAQLNPVIRGVGQLSSPCGQQGNLQQSGHSDFSDVVVLGDTEASEETRSMDRAEILSDATRTPVDLRRDARGPPRATAGTHALSCRRRADPTAREDQRDGKPLRPAMGSVL